MNSSFRLSAVHRIQRRRRQQPCLGVQAGGAFRSLIGTLAATTLAPRSPSKRPEVRRAAKAQDVLPMKCPRPRAGECPTMPGREG